MRQLWSLVLAVALLLPSSGHAALPKHLTSIRPLNWGETSICTTWSLNQRRKVWVTAAHCTVTPVYLEGEQRWELVPVKGLNIGGVPATALIIDVERDLALLTVDIRAPALRLGAYPHEGDQVTVYGFPGGWRTPLSTTLVVSNTFTKLYELWWMILDGHIWPGHSGSPVLDKKGRVVAVVQAYGTGRYAGMTFVSPWSALKRLGEGYWE